MFSTPERAERYIAAKIDTPKAHMDMLESLPESHIEALTEARFALMPLDADGLARAAAMVGADYLIRNPRPGGQQEIMRLT